MEFDDKEFKRKFPHLYEELEEPESGEEDSENSEIQDAEEDTSKEYPREVISYIRRARSNDEAIEVVDYLRKRGELTSDDATVVIKQIMDRGVRSFGSLKSWGHYEREFRKKMTPDVEDSEQNAEEESD